MKITTNNQPRHLATLAELPGKVAGAEFDYVAGDTAPRLWRLIERVRGGDTAAGSAFAGLHVGPFTLSEIRPDGSAVIGCHDIPHAEMAAMAARLNLEA